MKKKTFSFRIQTLFFGRNMHGKYHAILWKKQQLKNSIEMINHFGGQLANTVILYPACGDYICCFSTYALLF